MAKVYVYNLEIPFFPGYYDNSFLCPGELFEREYEDDDRLFDFIKHYGYDFSTDDIQLDYDSYVEGASKRYCEEVSKHLPPWISLIQYSHTWHPKEYNFATDECYAECNLKENFRELIMEFVNKFYDKLKNKIRNRWTSYDGFWSHTDNNIDNWITDIKESEKVDSTYLWYLWEYWLEFEHFPTQRTHWQKNNNFENDLNDFLYIPVYEDINIMEYTYYEKQSYIDRKIQELDNEKFLKKYFEENKKWLIEDWLKENWPDAIKK